LERSRLLSAEPDPISLRTFSGTIAMISRSGTYLSRLYPYFERRDSNFGEDISLGNVASIDLRDALEYFEGRSGVEIIAISMEGFYRYKVYRDRRP
jgi:acyl-CoA synthetase (NDP forming)